jgi:hypothetical protein
MAKDLSVGDFPIAARRTKPAAPSTLKADPATAEDRESLPPVTAPVAANEPSDQPDGDTRPVSRPMSAGPGTQKRSILSEEARQERQAREETRRMNAAGSRNRLRNLARAKTREVKHFVNVPLDPDTKARLERAAHENGLKMTTIMRDAIQTDLSEAGY